MPPCCVRLAVLGMRMRSITQNFLALRLYATEPSVISHNTFLFFSTRTRAATSVRRSTLREWTGIDSGSMWRVTQTQNSTDSGLVLFYVVVRLNF